MSESGDRSKRCAQDTAIPVRNERKVVGISCGITRAVNTLRSTGTLLCGESSSVRRPAGNGNISVKVFYKPQLLRGLRRESRMERIEPSNVRAFTGPLINEPP